MRRIQVLTASLLAFVIAGILAILLAASPAPRTHASAAAAERPDRKEVTVWVNTRSGVYHCPGSRWYGRTKYGKYMGECEAIKEGNRPAYGKPCGADCR